MWGILFLFIGFGLTIKMKNTGYGNLAFIIIGSLLLYLGTTDQLIESIGKSGMSLARDVLKVFNLDTPNTRLKELLAKIKETNPKLGEGVQNALDAYHEMETEETKTSEKTHSTTDNTESFTKLDTANPDTSNNTRIIDEDEEASIKAQSTVGEAKEHIRQLCKLKKIRCSFHRNSCTLTLKSSETKKALLSASTNYNNDGSWSSWNIINSAITDSDYYDYYFMTISDKNNINLFVLTQRQMREVTRQKQTTKHGFYHFYISNEAAGIWHEIRNTTIDFQKYYTTNLDFLQSNK
ncbi:hypothetical protein [Bifidobacterium psychraerophilum]|uniref:Uncharacterized protein n=1 Tax=Bifidobacterium psychraerophilum TaxID=218140 RepID=A0A087CE13_9BIFI|nr:hypothetical protein [Bifidobacterium psychraerophilum]KFI81513.1 hypothetical protein BPSY_1921 [Bifidobacterium psychraerophilum]PKA95857.1 hypothetical protein A9A89_2137 [Bifidobacterium psychraerophilum DSM 22366]